MKYFAFARFKYPPYLSEKELFSQRHISAFIRTIRESWMWQFAMCFG